MLTNKLEKSVVFYKSQFEKLCLSLTNDYRVERYSLDVDAMIFRIKYMFKRSKDLSTLPELKNEFINKALKLRKEFGNVMKVFLDEYIGYDGRFNENDIIDLFTQDVTMDAAYLKFKLVIISDNIDYLQFIDDTIIDDDVFNLFPNEYFRFFIDSYNDGIARAYPELFANVHQDKIGSGADGDVFCHSFTFQTSEYCSLNCTYCFEGGTPIVMADLTRKPIEHIQIGEYVLGFNENKGNVADRFSYPTKVERTFRRVLKGRYYYQLTTNHPERTFHMTGSHKVLTQHGWKAVKDLKEDDKIADLDLNIYNSINTDIYDESYINGYFVGYLVSQQNSIIPGTIVRMYAHNPDIILRLREYSLVLGIILRTMTLTDETGTKYTCLLSKDTKVVEFCERLIRDNLLYENMNFDQMFMIGFTAAMYDSIGILNKDKSTVAFETNDYRILLMIEQTFVSLGLSCGYSPIKIINGSPLMTMRLCNPARNLPRLILSLKNADSSKGIEYILNRRPIHMFTSDYKVTKIPLPAETVVYNLQTESRTYVANGVYVHNCYQFNKTKMRMSFDIAKRFVDNLLADKYEYINRHNSPAIILEFIGGEPLLEIGLTRRIYEYFLEQCYETNHPWFSLHRLSICSNGLQYFDKDVQSFFRDYHNNISFNISIDGNKELHDACRIQPNGEGSYDIDMAALQHYTSHYIPDRNSKMTLAPTNIKYLFESVKSFIENGMKVINLNCVFEEGWDQSHALTMYNELKKLSDYILQNGFESIHLSIFNERQEDVADPDMDSNSCFHPNTIVSTPSGSIRIENLKKDMKVYTASGNVHEVSKLSSYYSTNNWVLIVNGAIPIRCTADHEFCVNRNGQTMFVPVLNLYPDDLVALKILNLPEESNNHEWLTNDISELAGLYVTSGSVDNGICKIVIMDKDGSAFKLLNSSGLEFNVNENASGLAIYTIDESASMINLKFVDLCMACHTERNMKCVPNIIFELDSFRVSRFIDGILRSNSNDKVLFKTRSSSIASDVLLLMRSIYLTPYCNVNDGTYEIYLDDYDGSMMFAYDSMYGVFWTPIKSIIRDEDYIVYCPTVTNGAAPSEHTILVNGGVAAKNCGGSGKMLALRPNGQFYPCLRFMPTSVGKDVPDLCMGDVNTLVERSDGSDVLKTLDAVTRRSQTTDICYSCPLSNQCPNCSALSHAVFGTPNQKATFICIMQIAQFLANVYHWNMMLITHPEWNLNIRRNVIPDEWSLKVITKEELDYLKTIECMAMIRKIESETNEK